MIFHFIFKVYGYAIFLCVFVIQIEVPKEFFQNFDSFTSKNALLVYNGKLKICNVKFGQYCRTAEKLVKRWKLKKIRPLYIPNTPPITIEK